MISSKLEADHRIQTVDAQQRTVSSALRRAEGYLRLASLMAILLAAVAIGMGAHYFSRQHFDTAALLRCFGLSALQILQACVRSGQGPAQLLADLKLFPQVLINVRLKPGDDWTANIRLADETQRLITELGESGRVLIRPSGTEPLLRVMVEARDAVRAQACAERLALAVGA